MGEGEEGKGFAPLDQVTGGKPFYHVNDKGRDEAEDQQRVGKPAE